MEEEIIIKELKIRGYSVDFDLEFKNSVLFIDGKSGSGRAYLFKTLKDYVRVHDINNIILIDAAKIHVDNLRFNLENTSGKLIVIDNSDHLDAEMRAIIDMDLNNQYLIFDRNIWALGLNKKCFAHLMIDENNKGRFIYRYKL